MSDPDQQRRDEPRAGESATADRADGKRARVVRRREASEMTAEERAFVARYSADAPPHHDSSWG